MFGIWIFGAWVRDLILAIAGLLRNDAVPGLVAVALVILLMAAIVVFETKVRDHKKSLEWLRGLIRQAKDGTDLSRTIDELDRRVGEGAKGGWSRRRATNAWQEYRETLVPHEEGGTVILRNSARPNTFFNAEDLGFGPGFWRIVPGLFVTVGLFLTFLGLISALHAMDLRPDYIQGSLKDLLTIASAKFIMSLMGLLCSILFTIVLRAGMGRVDEAFHQLGLTIEQRLTFISLEALAVEQLRATREQREHFRAIGTELIAELGRPLREDLPAAISSSISAAMAPLLQQIGQAGAQGVGTMIEGLSSRFSDDVGRALSAASNRLVEAGDRIAALVDRMDHNSGRMGSEMDGAITRLSQAVEELKNGLGATATTASGAFANGAENMLAIMNQTLEGIRDNTSEGSRAMGSAANDLRVAAEGFRQEFETATRQGSAAATAHMDRAGQEASAVINAAGKSMLDAVMRSGSEIGRVAETINTKTASDLLAPLDRLTAQLSEMTGGIVESSTGLRRLADGIRLGADATEQAAGNMRGASEALVGAVVPISGVHERIESSIGQLRESTHSIAGTVARSSESTARSVESTLLSAQQVLGGEARAVEAALNGVGAMLTRLRGQGDRLDTMDEKLGRAFAAYQSYVEGSVATITSHIRDIQSELGPALDTLRSVVEQAEQFRPESRPR